MAEVPITYEQLFDTLRREKSKDDLQKLDKEFFDKEYGAVICSNLVSRQSSFLFMKTQTLNLLSSLLLLGGEFCG